MTFDDISSVSASWLRLLLISYYFLPIIVLNIEHVDIVHPLYSVVPSKVNDLRVDQAACRRNLCTWLFSIDLGLDPSKSLCIEIENVVKLSELIRFSTKNVYLCVKSDGRMLKPPYWLFSHGLNRFTPYEIVEVEYKKVV